MSHASHDYHQSDQRGFTIIELLIATTILSTILLMVTVMMISIGNLYYKGVNQARIQDDVRSTAEDVAQHLQLNNSDPTSGSTTLFRFGRPVPAQAYCVSSTRYSYVVGRQIGSGLDTDGTPQVPHVLWRDTIASGAACTPGNLVSGNPSLGTGGSNGVELIAPNSRLTFFQVSGISPYTVQIGVAYGNIDLLNLNLTGPTTTTCKGITGDQFCSTAGLTTTVSRRL